MAISISVDQVDQDGKELLTYGTPDFPIAFFDDDLVKVKVPWHWHNEFELVILTEGSITVKIAGDEFDLSKGEGYFANSSVLHSAELKTRTGHQRCLVFAPEIIAQKDELARKKYLDPVLENSSLPYIRLTSKDPHQKELLRLIDDAWTQGAYEKADYPLNVRYDLGKVFSYIVHNMELLTAKTGHADHLQKNEYRIKKALSYIEIHYASVITITDIAASAGISVSTCLRLFREVLHTTPIRYLMEYRIRKFIEESERSAGASISDIACACGFQDVSYFNRCFKKIHGCTPTQYFSENS